jgi:LysM repeat protein
VQTQFVATLICVAALVGCSKSHSRQPVPATTAAPATMATTTSAAGASAPAPELTLLKATPLSDGALLTFSAELKPASVRDGLLAYRETDADVGGAFERVGIDAQVLGNAVRVTARVPLDERELRLVLRATLRSTRDQPLVGGAGSAAISFENEAPDAVYELRFRARPFPAAGRAVAANTLDDHGGDKDSASPLAARVSGSIESAGDRDWFRLNLQAGEQYVLRTETSGDTVLTLYAADGSSVLGVNDDDPSGGRQSRLEYTPAGGGAHYVEIAGFGQSTPSYEVVAEGALSAPRLEPGDSTATAHPLGLGDRFTDAIGPNDKDWFSLDLAPGNVVIEVDHPDVTIMLLDAAGRGVADPVHVVVRGETLGGIAATYGIDYRDLAALNGVADPNLIEVGDRLHVPATSLLGLAVDAGRHHVRLGGFAGATPSYTLSVRDASPAPAPTPTPAPAPAPAPPPSDDHSNGRGGATPLTLGVTLGGAIEAANDTDHFALELTSGRTYEFVTSTSDDTILDLLDEAGAELASNDDDPQGGRGSRVVATATRTGRHYLRVRGYSSTTPSYRLSASERQASALPDATRFRPRARTDVWHIDFELRADLFSADLAAHGLRSGHAATDALMRERVIEGLLSHLSQKYRLDADGNAVSGVSWRVSFTSAAPAGRPRRDYSREAVGGTHEDGGGTLGVSYLDPGNRRKEDNDDLGELGIFSASIYGRDSRLRPALTAADRRYLDGSYLLGDGSTSDDRRFRRIRTVSDDWAHALSVVTAHEVGHSVGLNHEQSSNRGIMGRSSGC